MRGPSELETRACCRIVCSMFLELGVCVLCVRVRVEVVCLGNRYPVLGAWVRRGGRLNERVLERRLEGELGIVRRLPLRLDTVADQYSPNEES